MALFFPLIVMLLLGSGLNVLHNSKDCFVYKMIHTEIWSRSIMSYVNGDVQWQRCSVFTVTVVVSIQYYWIIQGLWMLTAEIFVIGHEKYAIQSENNQMSGKLSWIFWYLNFGLWCVMIKETMGIAVSKCFICIHHL